MDLPLLDTLCKWNGAIYDLSCLPSFPQCSVVRVHHACVSTLLPFRDWITVLFVCIGYICFSTHLLTDIWFAFHLSAIVGRAALNISVLVLCDCIFSPLSVVCIEWNCWLYHNSRFNLWGSCWIVFKRLYWFICPPAMNESSHVQFAF